MTVQRGSFEGIAFWRMVALDQGCKARGQRKNPNLTQMLNKVKGGNYHGFDNDPHHHPVDHSVRRRRRLLLD